jgi:DNA-binding transcriptional MerR regulator
MRPVAMRVGTLARRAGLSVRTLHYYDEIGLLAPRAHSEAGHRLYGADDIVRLQQILSLRQLGFSLDEIRAFLDDPDCSPLGVVELHLSRLREEIALQQQLRRQLEALAVHLQTAEEVSVDAFIQTIEAIRMYEKYYTPEQMKQLEERREQLGDAAIQKGQQDWADLYAQVRVEMEKGTDPTSEPVLRLARQAHALIRGFTGGDPGIEKSLRTMYEQEGPRAASRGMIDPAVAAYFAPAMEAARKENE